MINNLNDIKTFAIHTLGCKVNLYESNLIKNELLSYGFIEVDFKSKADLYIINTCSVTNNADAKSRNVINKAKKTNPESIVLVCGCYTQVNQKISNADIILGNKYKNQIISQLELYLQSNNKQQLINVSNILLEKEFESSKVDNYTEHTRAFIKIQDGCNFMCSYCIIPFTRGRQRSKDANDIIKEIIDLVNNGYKEIVITGVNTAGYNDLNNNINFYELLCMINKITGNFRVRISSVEPFQITDEIVQLICNNKRFCQHWHICLQSGDDNILKLMNRKYNQNEFMSLVKKIYDLNINSSITTDYIVGFPTESDTQFENSLEFCKKVQFYNMHIFPYSIRKYTRASLLNQVSESTKSIRMSKALALNKELNKQFLNKFINKELEVLIETQLSDNIYVGKSSEYINVQVKSNTNILNKMVLVKANNYLADQLICEFIKVLY